jgi:DNA mismatch repair protein MSH4
MSERPGVVNLHLTVDISDNNAMIMLYRIGEGFVKEEHYGLALARVVDLPSQILEVAEKVSMALDAQAAAKKKSSKAFALARRRKLVLGLKETLKQAESGPMEPKALLSWLRRLQDEFVRRMDQIENDVESSESDMGADPEDERRDEAEEKS